MLNLAWKRMQVYLESHTTRVSFPHLSLISVQATTLKQANTLWNSISRLFYLFIPCPLIGKASGLEIPVLYICTHRKLYIDLSDGKGRILHSSPLLKFPSDLLIKSAVHTTVCCSLKSSSFKICLSQNYSLKHSHSSLCSH